MKLNKLFKKRIQLLGVCGLTLFLFWCAYILLSILSSISAAGSIEIKPDPNYMIFYLTEELDYEYLFENPVAFFTDIRNSPLIYIAMFVILIPFITRVLSKRAFYLWKSFEAQRDVNNEIFNAIDSDKRKEAALAYDGERNVCRKFIFDIYKNVSSNSKLLKEYYLYYIKVEEDSVDDFTLSVNKYYTWIIRLGIIGTLIGVMIAFYGVAEAVYEITDFSIAEVQDRFKKHIREALVGNAIAVVTSLAAHTITIIFEIFVGSYFKNKSNIKFIDRSYKRLLALGDFDDAKASIARELRDAANAAIASINNLKRTADDQTQEVKKLDKEITIIKKTLDELNGTMTKLKNNFQKITTDQTNNKILELEKEIERIKNELKNIKPVKTISGLKEVDDKIKRVADELDEIWRQLARTSPKMKRIVFYVERLKIRIALLILKFTRIKKILR